VSLRVALVGGPMYDGLYEILAERDVEIVVHAPHPELNREVASMVAAGERIDVLSTHSKYAPSQSAWLHPLDDLLDVSALAPKAVELGRFDGALFCVPRNVDVRVLWAGPDTDVPTTWRGLVDSDVVFGFPGRESGLFGTFFELVVSHDGSLFDNELRPTMRSPACRAALDTLVMLATRAPDALTAWHYDEVDDALARGEVGLAAAWPGATTMLRSARPDLEPHPYLAGPAGLRSYAGCHGWGIPRTCGDRGGAIALLELLSSAPAHEQEARSGAVCAHVEAFAGVEPLDAVDSLRLEITRETIATGMITYPPLANFPAVEDAGWGGIRAALRGEVTTADALLVLQATAESALAGVER
jgi:multiple sugar transport system substrate-binding protein